MSCPTAMTRELVALLVNGGIEVRLEAPVSIVHMRRGASPTEVVLDFDAKEDAGALKRVLDEARMAYRPVAAGVVLDLVPAAPLAPLLAFDLPVRLPTLNPQLRTHWSSKSSELVTLAWEVTAALPRASRPWEPLSNIEIEIDRYCSNQPDKENLEASSKWLLDVLQPLDPKLRPYGLGVILEDAPWCLRDTRIRHVPSRQKLTKVRIYRSNLPPVTRSAKR